MRFFLKYFIMFAAVQSCSTVPIDSHVSVFLKPVHYASLALGANNVQQVQLLDNDGNMYITYWNVNALLLASFNGTVKNCRERIKAKRIFPGSIYPGSKSVSELSVDVIVPSVFKEFNLCIREGRYEHQYSDAFSPEKFQLSFFKGHSASDNYLPVGGSYHIYKKGSKFRDALIDVKKCKFTLDKSKKNGVSEIYTGGFVYVSIESYVIGMRECLIKDSYEFY